MVISNHKLSKLFSVIPNINIKPLPNNPEIIEPKLTALVSIAYIVPSIFLGHILQAKTNIGSKFNSEIMVVTKLSHIQKTLSGIPSSRLYLLIRIKVLNPKNTDIRQVVMNCFLN